MCVPEKRTDRCKECKQKLTISEMCVVQSPGLREVRIIGSLGVSNKQLNWKCASVLSVVDNCKPSETASVQANTRKSYREISQKIITENPTMGTSS